MYIQILVTGFTVESANFVLTSFDRQSTKTFLLPLMYWMLSLYEDFYGIEY